jgi:predicted GNAT family acetyltransferase
MGGFIPNAQAAIVPAALYLVYHTFVPKGAKGKGVLRSLSRKATAGLKRITGRK